MEHGPFWNNHSTHCYSERCVYSCSMKSVLLRSPRRPVLSASTLRSNSTSSDFYVAWNRAAEGIAFAQNVFTTPGSGTPLYFAPIPVRLHQKLKTKARGVGSSVSRASGSHGLTRVFLLTLQGEFLLFIYLFSWQECDQSQAAVERIYTEPQPSADKVMNCHSL